MAAVSATLHLKRFRIDTAITHSSPVCSRAMRTGTWALWSYCCSLSQWTGIAWRWFMGLSALHVHNYLGEVTKPFETCKPPPGLAGWMRLGL